MKTTRFLLLLILLHIGIIGVKAQYKKSAYAVLSTDGTTLTFFYDSQRPSRAYSLNTGNATPGWSAVAEKVTRVKFTPSFKEAHPKSCAHWFDGMTQLQEIDSLINLSADSVKTMTCMFRGCNLREIEDFYRLNTSKVTDMSFLFQNCRNLTSLDFGIHTAFDPIIGTIGKIMPKTNTEKVTTMESMFDGCTNLTTLRGLERFKTPNVTNMSSMFRYLSGLSTINVSSFDTSNVTDMSYMFYSCQGLTELDLSNFDTSNVKNMRMMFRGCLALPTLYLTNFDTSSTTDMYGMFWECAALTALDISSFRTPLVEDMCYMFAGCSSLPTLDVSRLIISSNSSYMFEGCSALKELFVPSSASDLTPGACTNVGTKDSPCALYYPDGFNLEKEDEGEGWFQWKSGFFIDIIGYAVFDGSGLTFYCDNLKYTRDGNVYELNEGHNKPGWYSDRASVTHVEFDSSFRNAKPKSFAYWFCEMEGLEGDNAIKNLGFVDASKVTTMFAMFYGCTGLTKIDGLDQLNTSSVTIMQSMFVNCVNLTSLDVSHFNTSNVINMYLMFGGCESLTSLDVSHFETSNVTRMDQMFAYCSSLYSLDLSNFDTSNVTYMEQMFYHCENLRTVDVSSFNTSNVKKMIMMFAECENLDALDISNFTINHYDDGMEHTSQMFSGCWTLQTLAVPLSAVNLDANACSGVGKEEEPCALFYPDGFNLVKDAEGEGWFQWKSGYFYVTDEVETYVALLNGVLTFANNNRKILYENEGATLYTLNDEKSNPGWFDNRMSVTKVVFDKSFATVRPISCRSWFLGMQKLKTIEGLNRLNTSEVTTMRTMFSQCTSLNILDLRHFDTSKVTNMEGMFSQCMNLELVDLTGFETSQVDSLGFMFNYCTHLESIRGLEGFNTSKATYMRQMFAMCYNLQSIDVSHFDTSKAEDMYFMFSYCISLPSLDLSHFTIPVEDVTYEMISNCPSLQKLTIPASAAHLSSWACVKTGSEDAPCQLICPAGFIPTPDEPSPAGAEWIKWKGGYFIHVCKGDVNNDGSVSIADVMMTISNIVSGESTGFNALNADMNDDHSINISDVMMMVNILVGK